MTMLRFTPEAYLHWQFLCHNGPTEASAFGITDKDDSLLVRSLWVPKQECTVAFTSIDDDSMIDFYEWADDNGQVGRVWLHTHPSMSATPSGTDEETFKEKFGECNIAVMGILSRTNDSSARVKYKVGGGNSFEIPIKVLWSEFPDQILNLAEKMKVWKDEYAAKVTEKQIPVTTTIKGKKDYQSYDHFGHGMWDDEYDYNWRNSGAAQKYKKKFKKNKGGILLVPETLSESDTEKHILRLEFEEYVKKAYDIEEVTNLNEYDLKSHWDDFLAFKGDEQDLNEIYPERYEMYEIMSEDLVPLHSI